MKEITIFEAQDGARFDAAQDCLRYEMMLIEITAALSILPKRNVELLAHGMGYIQHTSDQLAKFDHDFGAIIRKYCGNECGDRYAKNPTGYVWRILGDSSEPLSKAICEHGARRLCVDIELREWEQQYFTNNPNPKAVCVNAWKRRAFEP